MNQIKSQSAQAIAYRSKTQDKRVLMPQITDFRVLPYSYVSKPTGESPNGYAWTHISTSGVKTHMHTDSGDAISGGEGLYEVAIDGTSHLIKGSAQFSLSRDPEVAERQVRYYYHALPAYNSDR